MENNSFEQQFKQNVDNKMTELVSNPPKPPRSKVNVPVIISIILAIIVLIETIAICIMVHNHFASTNEDFYEVIELEEANDDILLDEEKRLVAMNLTCINDSGDYFTFSTDSTFEEYDSTSNLLGSGTYSVFNDSIIILNNPDGVQERTLYYNWLNLANGTTLYDCRTDSDENNA